jgi:hypothetical protein
LEYSTRVDLEKIGRAIIELESVDIDAELAQHAQLKLHMMSKLLV